MAKTKTTKGRPGARSVAVAAAAGAPRRSWFRVAAAGNRRARIAIDGVIGGWDVDARMFRRALEELGQIDELEVFINSPGGLVGEGVAIHNMLRRHKAHVTTVIEGYALSMGSVIAMAGDTVQMASSAIFMIHDPWSIALGSAAELRKEADVLDVHKAALIAAYTRRDGLDEAEVASLMSDETWMDADLARDLGFVDEVIDAGDTESDEADDDASARASGELARGELDEILERFTDVPDWAADRLHEPRRAAPRRPAPTRAPRPPTAEEDDDMKRQNRTRAAAAAGTAPAPTASAPAPAPGSTTPASPPAPAAPASAPSDVAEAEARGAAAERTRVAAINAAFAESGLPATYARIRDNAVADGRSVEVFQGALSDLTACQDATPAGREATAYAGEDARERFRQGAGRALAAAARVGDEDPGNEFRSMSMTELARASLNAAGVRLPGTRMDIVAMAFTHSTSDFPHILHDIAHRSLMEGFEEVDESYQAWTREGTFRDFRVHERIGWNGFENLELVPEGAEYKRDTFEGYKESARIDTWGKMFSITRQAIINDDIGVFSQVPQMFGEAARRTIGAKAIEVLLANPKMGDGKALFHADHGNIDTAPTAISTDSVSAIRRKMALNKGRRTERDAMASGIRPNILLCPLALEDRALVLAASEGFIGAGSFADNDSNTPNSVRNTFTVVADPRLDEISSTDWYMVASRRPPVEIGYLDGNRTPYLEAKNGWSIDGVEWKVRLDAGWNAVEFMTIFRQKGAA